MKFISLVYLFIETMALLMVITILSSPPDAMAMGQFERFGYASAALGLTLLIIKQLKKKYSADLGAMLLVAVMSYPVSLWVIYELVESSPSWIPQSIKPWSLQRAYITLSGLATDADVDAHWSSVVKKYPVPDEAIRQINLDGIRALSSFYQSTSNWAHEFKQDKYQRPAELSVLNNVMRYSDFLHSYENALVASLSGVLAPLTSRTIPQLSLLYHVDPELVGLIPGNSHRIIMNEHVMHLAERRFLREIGGQFPDLRFDLDDSSQSWDFVLREAITMHVIKQTGVDYQGGSLAFPWYKNNSQFLGSAELKAFSYYITPFFFDEEKRMLLDVPVLMDEKDVKQIEQNLSGGLADSVRDQFNRFYHRIGLSLANSPEDWVLPISKPLFSGWVRIGVILPMMGLLSLVLLIVNGVATMKSGLYQCIGAVLSIAMASALFYSPYAIYVIKAMLLVSVPEPILFKG